MLGVKRIFTLKRKDVSFNRILKAIIIRVKYIFQIIEYFLPFGFYARNRRELKSFKDLHKGKRCFIIATGPSLKDINFDLLRDEYLITMNRGYMIEEKFNILPNYLMCIDHKTQLKQFRNEYNDLNHIPTFYDFRLHRLFDKIPNRYFILTRFSPKFISDNGTIFGNGKSVTYTCIQFAYYLGFKEVYLIGKDHSYNTSAMPGTSVEVKENTQNHFIKGYYNKKQIFDAPDYTTEEFAYQVGLSHFQKNKRTIFDATVNGKLEVFPKVKLEEIFNKL